MTDSVQVRRERLQNARTLMAEHGVDALIIPSADPHMSEYLPVYWQGRAWLSGFTGSVGTLVITADFAGVWTDSRYWVQAPMQLEGTGIELQKMQIGRPTFSTFLAEHLPSGAKVAIDGNVLSVNESNTLKAAFGDKGIELVTTLDLLAKIWSDRPSLPTDAIYEHPAQFVDTTAADKLAKVRNAMSEKGANAHLISSLDDIAWLVNLRGSYSWKTVRLDFGIENLFDKFYYLPTGGAYAGQGTTMTNPALPNYPQWGTAVPGMGRSVYVGLNVTF